MKKIWINKTDSFKDAEKFDNGYYLCMTPLERLDIVQFLREKYFKMKRRKGYENRKRLRRSIKIIK